MNFLTRYVRLVHIMFSVNSQGKFSIMKYMFICQLGGIVTPNDGRCHLDPVLYLMSTELVSSIDP